MRRDVGVLMFLHELEAAERRTLEFRKSWNRRVSDLKEASRSLDTDDYDGPDMIRPAADWTAEDYDFTPA